MVSSRVIAEELERKHKNVLFGIDEVAKNSTADISALFIKHQYKDLENADLRSD